MQGEVLEQLADGVLSVVLAADDDLNVVLERVGQVPIPPYLARDPEPSDTVRYQTVFAMSDGSVAAPTASLHIAPRTLARLEERGVRTARLTLHVGLGTFRAVTADDLDGHEMHCEWLRVDQSLCAAVREARMRGAPIVAVGTTVVRALETAAMESGSLEPYEGDTRIFIRPGHEFRVVDALLTNFHVPRSTLLALVAAFVGLERVLEAYREAVRSRYRFLSYGDAMWIPQRS
jgi:S-adenosylmethionine:tRNA ribosyltransferase-isomerase